MERLWVLGATMMAILCAAENGRGRMRERSVVPPAQQWRLEDLYASDQAWKKAKDELAGRLEGILAFQDTLTQSAAQMLSCLQLNSEVSKSLGRLHAYAAMNRLMDEIETILVRREGR